MEKKRITISAEYSDFKKCITDFLLRISSNSSNSLRPTQRNGLNLYYTVFGALITYEISISGKGLIIDLLASNYDDERIQLHIDNVAEEVSNNFSVGAMPLALEGLISDKKYLNLLQERWEESEKTKKAGAWLSTIVLLGSILEDVLLYILKKNFSFICTSSVEIPMDEDDKGMKTPKQPYLWTLDQMIRVSYKLGWISKDTRNFADIVREYRNFVHPWKELNKKLKIPSPRSCKTSADIIEGVIEELLKVKVV